MIPQAQQVADSVTSAAAIATNQTQTATQSGAPASQSQSQAVAAPITQAQAATTVAQPTQEQQKYSQYYQYGHDPYQQYYMQQLAAQQFQPNVQGQLQPQVYTQHQAQPRPQAPLQAPAQQHHHQPQPQPQPQPQVLSQGNPQLHAYVQGPVAQHNLVQLNPQQQLQSAVQPPHGLVPLQPQPYHHQQPQLMQPNNQSMQAPQYQHPHSQMPPQQQQYSWRQLHPPQLQPQLRSPVQPQGQQPSPQAVTGHSSYPQVQAHQQMLPPPPRPHPLHIHPSSGTLPHGQFPPPPPQMCPPQSHTSLPNQLPPALLPSQGQVTNIPPSQQQQIHPHTQQPGHAVQQRQIQQPVPQQCVQQPFPGQTGPIQTRLRQHTPVAPQQPMHSQSRPQGPPPTHLQPQHGVAHAMHSHQSQPFSQSPGAFGVPSQAGPMQLGSNQASGHQSQQQFVQSGPSIKTMAERRGDVFSDGTVVEQEARSPSQKTTGKGDNGGGADSLNVKALKAETGLKFHADEHEPLESEDKDSEVHAVKDGSGEPLVKQTVKEEGNGGTLDSLPGGKLIEIAAGEGKKVEHTVDDSSFQGTDSVEANKGKLPTGVMDVSMQSSTGTDNVISHGNIQYPLVSREDHVQHSYQGTPQGLGFDESGGLHGKGFVQSSHPVPSTDQGRHQLPPMSYGPSTHNQRPGIPPMVKSGPLPGPPCNEQVPGYPPNPLKHQGPGHLSQPEQLAPGSKQHGSSHPDVTFGGVLTSGSTVSLGKGLVHFGHLQSSFERQSSDPQKQYGQGPMPFPRAAFPRTSQGEPTAGPALGAAPPGLFGAQGGLMRRAPPHVHEGQFGQHRPINPVETEMFHNQRPHNFDSRHPDSHIPGYLERGPFGQPSGIESGKLRMDGAPGHGSLSTNAFRDGRHKSIIEDCPNPFSLGQTQRFDQEEFEKGSKQFRRPSHLSLEASPKFGSYISSLRTTDTGPNGHGIDASLRPLDKPPRGSNYDAGLQRDSGYGGIPSRFFPSHHAGGALHPNDDGERAPSIGHNDDRFGRHHTEHLTPRSPGREYGVSSHGFPLSGFVDIDGREPHSFGEGSRTSNLPPDQGGNSSRGIRVPIFPGHLQRGELGGPGNLRMGEHLSGELIGQDNPPGHLRRGELLGPRNLPSHMRLGEFDGPGSFPHHIPFGEPGFRSSYPMHGLPNDGGFHLVGVGNISLFFPIFYFYILVIVM